jgi:hypothetical protein
LVRFVTSRTWQRDREFLAAQATDEIGFLYVFLG